jgi:hypothetical protein
VPKLTHQIGPSLTSKNGPGKFVAAKARAAHTSLSQQSNPQNTTGMLSDGSRLTDRDVQVPILQILHIFVRRSHKHV